MQPNQIILKEFKNLSILLLLCREDGIKESNLSKTPGICTAANLLLIDNYLLFLYEELTQKCK